MPASPVFIRDIQPNDGSTILLTWTLTTAVPDGVPLEWGQWADRYVQAVGSPWGAATASMEGSNDGVNWSPLSNAAGGAAATFAANGGKTLIEVPRYMRPNLTAVGVGANVQVILFARRAQPLRT